MERKTCWNCLHEYQCDWTPAGKHDHCKEWVEEYIGKERELECQSRNQ